MKVFAVPRRSAFGAIVWIVGWHIGAPADCIRCADSVDAPPLRHGLAGLNDRGLSYLISYDGRTGDRVHGRVLPAALGLERRELDAGRSTQATLSGGTARTVESLYLSPALVARL